MPIFSDQDFQALMDRVRVLEAQVAELQASGGWATFATGAWKKVEPYVTPVLVAASAAIVIWIQSLHGAKIDAAANDSRQAASASSQALVAADKAAVVSDTNATKIEATKAAAQDASAKATQAVDQSKANAEMLATTHDETKAAIEGVKKAVDKPRPIFPGKEGKEP